MIGADRSVHGGVSAVVNQYYEAGLHRRVRLVYIGTMKDGSRGRKLVTAAAAYLRFLGQLPGMDILHVHLAPDASFYRKRIFIRTAALFRKKIVIQEHGGDFQGFYDERSSAGQKAKIRRTLQKADRFLVLSEEWAAFFRPLLGGKEPEVLENGILPPAESKREDCGHTILFLGRLEKAKGIGELLDAVRELEPDYPELRLTLGGVWLDEELRQRAEQDGHVRFLGWITGAEKEAQFEQNSIFVMPSYFEGQPVALLEAMVHGLAPAASAVGGIPQILRDKENGFLVRPQSVPSLAEALRRLLSDPALRRRLGKEARKTILERYDVRERVERLVRIYEGLAEEL